MKIQLNLGSNSIIIFDECMHILKISTKKNWNRNIIKLSRKKYLYFASLKNRNLLFGITHERIHLSLRGISLKELIKIGFDRYISK